MRPRDPKLREKYRSVVRELRNEQLPITLKSVSERLQISFGTARNFLYRNPRLARELGLATREHKTVYEYIDAAKALDQRGEKITAYTLAEALGRHESAVSRFLRNHWGVRALIYEKTGALICRGPAPENVIPRSDIAHLAT